MSIPTGFYSDLTKNYFGIDPASQTPEEKQISSTLWRDFLLKVSAKEDPYFDIISNNDEEKVRESLITMASTYVSPLTDATIENLGILAHELATKRGAALVDLTSKDTQTVKSLLLSLLAPYVDPADPFLVTIIPSIATEIATKNAENEKLYFAYLSGRLDTSRLSEITTALSPQELTERKIVYSIFDILLTLINLMSNTQIIASTSEMPFLQKKEEYVSLMKKMFSYKGYGSYAGNQKITISTPAGAVAFPKVYIGTKDTKNTETIFSEDPLQYDLGYGHIKLQDIFDYVYESAIASSNTAHASSFDLTSLAGSIKGDCVISVSKNETTGTYTISTTFARSTYNSHSKTWVSNIPPETLITYTQNVTPKEDFNAKTFVMDALKTTFYQTFTAAESAGFLARNASDIVNPNATAQLKIQWEYQVGDPSVGVLLKTPTSSSDTQNTIINAANKIRTERNKVLNSYMEGIKSRITLIDDKIDSQNQMVDGASTGKKQTLNIIQTIIRQLQNLTSSIYR